MTLFNYKAIDTEGNEIKGSIEAINRDIAINAVQRRGLIIEEISSAHNVPFWEKNLAILERVSMRDVVILSRQISTLFSAQVSALKVFGLLSVESENQVLQRALSAVVGDLRGGSSISKALSKHPKIFSSFYVNMVRSGEESPKTEKKPLNR